MLALRSLGNYDFTDLNLLCVGPRNEAELFLLRAHGFKVSQSIDLFSYTPHITPMDMNDLDLTENSVDVYYSSAVIRYSPDIKKTVSEAIRVTKHGGLIAIMFTFDLNLKPGENELVPVGSELQNGLGDLLKLFDGFIDVVHYQNEFKEEKYGHNEATAIFKIKKTAYK